MVSKLKFKGSSSRRSGSSNTKKRKQVENNDDDDAGSNILPSKRIVNNTQQDEYTSHKSLWTTAKDYNDLNGPCMFVLSTDPVTCIACDGNGKLYVSKKFHSDDGVKEEELDKDAIEPDSVQQVFIISQLPISTSSNAPQDIKYAIKTHDGQHYLSADEYGSLEATSQAVGPDEQFTFVEAQYSAGFAIQSIHHRFLSFQDIDGAIALRADSESVATKESLTLRVQSKFRKIPQGESTSGATRISESISRKKLQEMVGGGNERLDSNTVKELKRAWKEGRINEALLDVRTKIKTDHRC